ncbi:hypothetical protein GCM10027614_83410 [Micromonospora vulcania]
MEITQFTYFQQVGGLECFPVTSEITYGVERLASYIQDKENVFDLEWTEGISYRDIFFQAEFENSTYAFETSNTDMLLTLLTHMKEKPLAKCKTVLFSQHMITY